MIGGIIINTEEFQSANKLRLDIVTDQYKEKHSVFVKLNSAARCIQEDDSAFWEADRDGGTVYWSPKARYFHDYPLKKFGKSFQTKSEKEKELVGK